MDEAQLSFLLRNLVGEELTSESLEKLSRNADLYILISIPRNLNLISLS